MREMIFVGAAPCGRPLPFFGAKGKLLFHSGYDSVFLLRLNTDGTPEYRRQTCRRKINEADETNNTMALGPLTE